MRVARLKLARTPGAVGYVTMCTGPLSLHVDKIRWRARQVLDEGTKQVAERQIPSRGRVGWVADDPCPIGTA